MTSRRVVGAVVAGILTVSLACGQEQPPPAAEEPAPEVDAEPAPDADTLAPIDTTVLSREEVFPHRVHRLIDCRTCHQRVPSHTTHATVACTQCHLTPASFAASRQLAPTECLACHHGGEHQYTCAECHESTSLPPTLTVPVTLHVAVDRVFDARDIQFPHARHRDLACTDCHASEGSAPVQRECTSCHADHHNLENDCTACHLRPEPEIHAERAHLGCGGAGCHVEPVTAAFGPQRPVCMACHTDLADHQPGRECADCHVFRGWTGEARPEGMW